MDDKKCCRTCKYCEFDWEHGYMCMIESAEDIVYLVWYRDCCDKWEGKE